MNLYNSKKLKTFKSKKLTVKCNTVGGQRRKSKQHNPSKPPKPSKQQVPASATQGLASATQGLTSGVSGTPSSLVTSALKRVQAARIAHATAASSDAADAADVAASASGVSQSILSKMPISQQRLYSQAAITQPIPPPIPPPTALVDENRYCIIKSKKKTQQKKMSDIVPIYQEIKHDSMHILSSDIVKFNNLGLFNNEHYKEIIIDKSDMDILKKTNFNLYYENEFYIKDYMAKKKIEPISRSNSTLPNNVNHVISTQKSTVEKLTKVSTDISKYYGKRIVPLSDYSKNLIRYTADIELITSAKIMNVLASMFFIYFNSALDNSDCNKNDIAGIRIYDFIDGINNTVNYYEKKISNLKTLRNHQEIVLVDYNNYKYRMEDVIKLFGRGSIKLNIHTFDLRDICKVHPNKLFIFIRTVKYEFKLYKLVEKDNNYNNLLYINVFGRPYVGQVQNSVINVNQAPGRYKSIMTDDFLLIELYNFLTKKKFDVSIISRDKYDIIINKYYKDIKPTFNIYKYDVEHIRTGYKVKESKVKTFKHYNNFNMEKKVRMLIAKPITNIHGVHISINNLTNAVNDITRLSSNSNYYHSFLLLIYILQNYAP